MFETKILFDLLVNGNLIVVEWILSSDRDLRNGQNEIDLFLDLLEWLKDHAGARTSACGAAWAVGRFILIIIHSKYSQITTRKIVPHRRVF